jgi:hypothetical protein
MGGDCTQHLAGSCESWKAVAALSCEQLPRASCPSCSGGVQGPSSAATSCWAAAAAQLRDGGGTKPARLNTYAVKPWPLPARRIRLP